MAGVLYFEIVECGMIFDAIILGGGGLIAMLGLIVWISYLLKNEALFTCLNISAANELKSIKDKLDIVKKIQTLSEPSKEILTSNDDISFMYKMIPADRISGDIFGLYHVSKHETLFWIGDVIGHGIDAGLIMIAIQSIIQTIIRQNYASTLKELFTKLNSSINEAFNRTMKHSYDTSFLILHYINNTIKFAGYHENIIHYNAKRKVFNVIDTSEFGVNLGTVSDTKEIARFIENGVIEFAPGDTLILYSDGLIEAQNKNQEQYGLKRFMSSLAIEFIQNGRDRTSEDIMDHLIADVKIFAGPEKFKDDVTLIIINNECKT